MSGSESSIDENNYFVRRFRRRDLVSEFKTGGNIVTPTTSKVFTHKLFSCNKGSLSFTLKDDSFRHESDIRAYAQYYTGGTLDGVFEISTRDLSTRLSEPKHEPVKGDPYGHLHYTTICFEEKYGYPPSASMAQQQMRQEMVSFGLAAARGILIWPD